MEDLIDNNTLLCLTETQHKFEKINFNKNIKTIVSMRDLTDKKGGGLMLIHKNLNVNLNKCTTINKDILIVEGKIYNLSIKIILVYLSVNDFSLNKNIIEEINKNINKELDIQQDLLILGDFNGHVGFLGPQKINKNGELLLDLIDKNNLILQNNHIDCIGEITWERGENKSTIDYIIVNNSLHNKFISMNIDEERNFFDLSDHNLITASYEIPNKNRKSFKHQGKKIEIIKINGESKNNFMNSINNSIFYGISMEEYQEHITLAKNKHLCQIIKIRTSTDNKNETNKIWFNKEIYEAIKLRKAFNKKARNEKK